MSSSVGLYSDGDDDGDALGGALLVKMDEGVRRTLAAVVSVSW